MDQKTETNSFPGAEGPEKLPPGLYNKYRSRLFSLCLKKTGCSSLSEDIVQETFVVLMETIRDDKLRNYSSIPAFLMATSKILIQQHFRRESRIAVTGSDDAVSRLPDNGTDTQRATQAEEDLRLLKTALSAMKPRDRTLIQLSFIHERPVDEICRRLNMTPGSFKVALHRIRKRLRLELAREHKVGRLPNRNVTIPSNLTQTVGETEKHHG